MDSCEQEQNECIRKIEDIIDLEKAKGSFSNRQVAFNLPSESGSTVSTNLAKSLESGLSDNKPTLTKRSFKKLRSKKRRKSPLPDVISWPSDSDITVLRMKLCLTSDLKENVINTIPGDGIHQPDSSSMVNLATLILQSRHPSKHSVDIEEYLLPLTSWEREQNRDVTTKEALVEILPSANEIPKIQKKEIFEANYSKEDDYDNSSTTEYSRKSKVARFLRLYFCPCCTCLYELETIRDRSSVCFTKRKEEFNTK
ncbi:uncharacterized protein LOC128672952 [Plodia interpunctella]|uniref:uncharacterized protein LOC128672952 n=1 Tax=Plodia interpunctella TaxID=58824 RepID=UPI002368ED87|nr:uncharacterized protein LOC128672952 [Plodia interpunctella]